MEQLLKFANDVANWYNMYSTAVFIGVASALFVCLGFDIAKRRWPSAREAEEAMNRNRREKWLKDYLSWCITEAFEEAVFLRKITRQEADDYYDLIGRRCRMHYLIPKFHNQFPDAEKLKHAIRKRIRGRLPIRKIMGKPKITLSVLRRP